MAKIYLKITFLRDAQFGDHSFILNGDSRWYLNILYVVYFGRDFVQKTMASDLIAIAARKAAQMAKVHSPSIQFLARAAGVWRKFLKNVENKISFFYFLDIWQN